MYTSENWSQWKVCCLLELSTKWVVWKIVKIKDKGVLSVEVTWPPSNAARVTTELCVCPMKWNMGLYHSRIDWKAVQINKDYVVIKYVLLVLIDCAASLESKAAAIIEPSQQMWGRWSLFDCNYDKYTLISAVISLPCWMTGSTYAGSESMSPYMGP